jgi:hypothetical protein
MEVGNPGWRWHVVMANVRGCASLVCVVAAVLGGQAAMSEHATKLGVDGSRFTLDGKPTFLLGMSYYGALGAPADFVRRDLDDLQARGFNWVRVWATWVADGNDVSAVDHDGSAKQPGLARLLTLVG